MSNRQMIDARGSFCPGPLMELIAAIKTIEVGDEVEVLSSDKGSANDIPAWANKVGHEVVENHEHEDHWSVVVKRSK